MTETEQHLRQLVHAIVSGKTEQARQSTNASLAVGATVNDVLDAVLEAVNILIDLHQIGEMDQARLATGESAVSSSLSVMQDRLAESEKRWRVKATVGPVGCKAGGLLSVAMSALLRSAGFQCVSLSKTQTPLELFRNSEELGANLVVPLLSGEDAEARIRDLLDEMERGGFKSKFSVIPLILGLPEHMGLPLRAARNPDEAVSEALQWVHRRAT